MNRRNATLAVIVLIALAALTLYLFSQQKTPQSPTQNTPTLSQGTSPTPGNDSEFSYKCEKDKSALELLQDKAEDIKTQDSSLGELVTSINGKDQGGGKYWLYQVDDKEATIGAEQYICQGEENIKWELK